MTFSAHLSMLFRELPYLERPAAAAAAGFKEVETWWPGDDLIDAWVREVSRHGLAVRLLNCNAGDLGAGERGFLNVPARRGETLAAFRTAAAVAARCEARFINLLVGCSERGMSYGQHLRVAADVLAECSRIAEAAGTRIVIEAINDRDIPGYLVPTPNAAVELIELAGADQVLLLYDAYHAARMGEDPCIDVTRWIPRLGHVHYADCPGRGAPGTGTTDLSAFVRALETGGYDGAIGLEFETGPTTPDALYAMPSW